MTNTTRKTTGLKLTRRGALAAAGATALAGALPLRRALAADKVTLRTNWLFYGSHSIFFLGIDKGYLRRRTASTSWSSRATAPATPCGSSPTRTRTFAYASAVTMMKIAAQGAPIIAVATIDATGTDAVLVNPDSGIKTFKDLEGKKVLTTAGAGVNTMFPVAARMPASTSPRSSSPMSPKARWSRAICRVSRRPMLGGIDNGPAEIEANGGKPPIIFNYTDYGVYQPGYAIVAHRDMVKENPDMVKRFVKATLLAVKEAPGQSGCRPSSRWSTGRRASRMRRRGSRRARCSMSRCRFSIRPTTRRSGSASTCRQTGQAALELLTKYTELKTDMKAEDFYTNEFVPDAVRILAARRARLSARHSSATVAHERRGRAFVTSQDL